MKTLLAIVGAVVLMALSSIWYGYVLSVIWGWFIAPTFNITYLSVPVAIGLSAAIRFITTTDYKDRDEDRSFDERLLSGAIKAFIVPAMTLFFCWIVKFWM